MIAGSTSPRRLRVAVVGAGVSGLSAAWLLSRTCEVTVYEAANRAGGHTNTLDVARRDGALEAVDTGFIVYNERNYPNFVALMDHLGVQTRASDMSFSVSLDGGGLEYGSTDLGALFAQKRNLLRPRFWSMLWDLQRFYKHAPRALQGAEDSLTLGDFLDQQAYGKAFQRDHLLPQAAAIWSSSAESIRAYPFASFVRFFNNHGLLDLNVAARPQWRTIVGGSRAYIDPLTAPLAGAVKLDAPIVSVSRTGEGAMVIDRRGERASFDHVVIAAHAPEALAMLADPTPHEQRLLGAMRYRANQAVLHTDGSLMPKRRRAWSAWNYVSDKGGVGEVTYWMNRLQGLRGPDQFLVSLNPPRPPRTASVLAVIDYEHPVFDLAAATAQRQLWSLQGQANTWFCGAYFGAGFHEDGLQSGLAVAEAIGGTRRPWSVKDESGRIFITPDQARAA